MDLGKMPRSSLVGGGVVVHTKLLVRPALCSTHLHWRNVVTSQQTPRGAREFSLKLPICL